MRIHEGKVSITAAKEIEDETAWMGKVVHDHIKVNEPSRSPWFGSAASGWNAGRQGFGESGQQEGR
jgi:hypothetical protein